MPSSGLSDELQKVFSSEFPSVDELRARAERARIQAERERIERRQSRGKGLGVASFILAMVLPAFRTLPPMNPAFIICGVQLTFAMVGVEWAEEKSYFVWMSKAAVAIGAFLVGIMVAAWYVVAIDGMQTAWKGSSGPTSKRSYLSNVSLQTTGKQIVV